MQLPTENDRKCICIMHASQRYNNFFFYSRNYSVPFSGFWFEIFKTSIDPVITHPCNPSPCGPNSQCREVNGLAVCTCVIGFIGSPPTCRPECIVSTDCAQFEACINQKCKDPCPGTCGIRATCQVINHNPICSCPQHLTGDPFIRCTEISKIPFINFGFLCFFSSCELFPMKIRILSVHTPPDDSNPCLPSPCGLNAQCQVINDSPSCSCLPEFIGSPPNCRPECVSNSECSSHLACINRKCKDPCPGSCGANTECRVVSHTPMCICIGGYTGDPFTQCSVQQSEHSAYKRSMQFTGWAI